jgi:hypothetical protein
MHQWRVTKYDPRLRDSSGTFLGEDWTSWSDIGKPYKGSEFTLEDYQKMENAYLEAARNFFIESGVPYVTVGGLEVGSKENLDRAVGLGLFEALELREGQQLELDDALHALRMMLREFTWCRLEFEEQFFIHVGYDYYMYIGAAKDMSNVITKAQQSDLFVEQFDSPYYELSGAPDTT